MDKGLDTPTREQKTEVDRTQTMVSQSSPSAVIWEDSTLVELLHQREYTELCSQVELSITSRGWREVALLFRKIQDSTEVSRGTLRDGLLRILGLDIVSGIDVDLIKAFGMIKAKTLDELRQKVIPIALRKLKYQIRRMNTLSLDASQLSGTIYEVLIQSITKVRDEVFFLSAIIGASSGSLRQKDRLAQNRSLLKRVKIRTAILKALRFSENPIGIIGDVHDLGLLRNEEFKQAALERISLISKLLRRKKKDKISSSQMEVIASVPLFYVSDDIRRSLSSAIIAGKSPDTIIEGIRWNRTLSKNEMIHNAVAMRLSSKEWSMRFLQLVMDNPMMMRRQVIQSAVAGALESFWTGYRPQADHYPAPEKFLEILADYRQIGYIERFQKAVSVLIKNDAYPVSILKSLRPFRGLVKSEIVYESLKERLMFIHHWRHEQEEKGLMKLASYLHYRYEGHLYEDGGYDGGYEDW